MVHFRKNSLLEVSLKWVLVIIMGGVLASLTGCTPNGHQTPAAASRVEDPSELKGLKLADARVALEDSGWTVKAVATKKRSIGSGDEDRWQVVKVKLAEETRVATLTVGKLSRKVKVIDFKTKVVKRAGKTTSYRKVEQRGERGRRVITFLDGKRISSKVTKKPVTKIVGIGTRRPYTGGCTIRGGYARRYVRCSGYYDPAAKRAAQRLASRCNSTTSPLAECRNVSGRYFS